MSSSRRPGSNPVRASTQIQGIAAGAIALEIRFRRSQALARTGECSVLRFGSRGSADPALGAAGLIPDGVGQATDDHVIELMLLE